MSPYHFPRFAGTSCILSHNSEYFVISENELIETIKKDSLNIETLTKIIDTNANVYAKDKDGEYQRLLINYSLGLANLFYLDDTGVYKIGEKHYVIRRLKYAYLNDVELKHLNDDGKLDEYNNDHLRLFLFFMELLPTSPLIEGYLFKRKYELDEFWHGNIMEQ